MGFCVLFGARLDISFGFISIEQKNNDVLVFVVAN
jgi:hypothetical protein